MTSQDFSGDMFALDLGPLADGLPNVPVVYRDAEHFFRTSHLTTGLRGLLDDVLSRLAGVTGNRALKLMTPFGGGKSHTLAALWHAARDRSALDVLSEAAGLPRPAGVQDGHFGYVSGPKPTTGPDGKFQVALAKVRFKTFVADDEIDLNSGFLILPQAIPQAMAEVGGGTPVVATGGGESGIGGAITGGTTIPAGVSVSGVAVPPAKPVTDKTVDISFTADRTGLFTAWNAIANLADLTGQVQVAIHAESEIGFEMSKLQNGFLEPLREANLID